MRRFLFWTMLISGLLMIAIGVAEAHVHPLELPVAHIIVAFIFTAAIACHLVLNRKAVASYLRAK